METKAKPFVKWIGGKRQLLDVILPLFPEKYNTYCEPFLGGGAVFFSASPSKAILNDTNTELITTYQMIRDYPEELIEELKHYKNTSDFFYMIRNMDRDSEQFSKLSSIKIAARFIYLNKTCFNGIYRVNSSGFFNTPYGKYKNPKIADSDGILAASKYLKECNAQFYNEDFAVVLSRLNPGDFVYLDPPYDPLSRTSSFTGYVKNGFSRDDQIRLRNCCIELDKKGVYFMLSNSATDFIKEIYKDFEIRIVNAKRAVNAKADGRGNVEEVIIKNY